MSWPDGVTLYVRAIDRQARRVWYGEQLQYVEHKEPGRLVPCTCEIELAAAQNLMDELWKCGLRPTEGKGSAGSLAATERHLEDMRRLAFHKILKEKP